MLGFDNHNFFFGGINPIFYFKFSFSTPPVCELLWIETSKNLKLILVWELISNYFPSFCRDIITLNCFFQFPKKVCQCRTFFSESGSFLYKKLYCNLFIVICLSFWRKPKSPIFHCFWDYSFFLRKKWWTPKKSLITTLTSEFKYRRDSLKDSFKRLKDFF